MNKGTVVRVTGVAFLICITFGLGKIVNNEYWLSILILMEIDILLTSSLRVIYSLDLISLGHVGFSLIGSYASALLVLKLGFPFLAALLVSGLFVALISFALGYPFLKLRGIYFCILTFMTSEVFRLIAYSWQGLTGGQYGLPNVPSPNPINIFGIFTISFDSMTNYYYLNSTIVVLSLFIIYGLERSHLNDKFRAIRDADSLALSVGMNIMWYKVINFTVACFFAGIAGALFAYYEGGLSAEITSRFGVITSLYLVVYMVIGGKRNFSGPIIGTILIELLTELSRPLGEYRPILIGILTILFGLVIPEGLVSVPSRMRVWANDRWGDRKYPKIFSHR